MLGVSEFVNCRPKLKRIYFPIQKSLILRTSEICVRLRVEVDPANT